MFPLFNTQRPTLIIHTCIHTKHRYGGINWEINAAKILTTYSISKCIKRSLTPPTYAIEIIFTAADKANYRALTSISSLKRWKCDSLSLEMCVHSGSGKHGPQTLTWTVTGIISNQNDRIQHRRMRLLWLHVRGCSSARHTQSIFIFLLRFHKADDHICVDISSQKLTPSRVAQQPPADEFIPLSRQLINKIRPPVYIKEEKNITFTVITVLIINVAQLGSMSEKANRKITEQNGAFLKFKDYIGLLEIWKRYNMLKDPVINDYNEQELTSHCRWGGMFLICSFLVLWR